MIEKFVRAGKSLNELKGLKSGDTVLNGISHKCGISSQALIKDEFIELKKQVKFPKLVGAVNKVFANIADGASKLYKAIKQSSFADSMKKLLSDFKSSSKATKGGMIAIAAIGLGTAISVISSGIKMFHKDDSIEQKYQYKQKIQNSK